jgi:hypothetical protein
LLGEPDPLPKTIFGADKSSLIHFSLVLNGLYHRIQAARDKNRINVLLHQLDNSEFGGLGPLHSHFWTDKEITSIFRISTTGDVARGYIISILCEIHNEDTKAYKQVPTPLLRFQAAVERKIRGILDGVTWGDFELAVLYEALENAEATELKMNGEGEYDSGDVYDTNSNVDLPSLSNETG